MIYIYVIVAAIVTSLIFKRNVWNPLNTNFKWFYLIFIPFILELIAVFGNFDFSNYLTSIAYIILIIFCIANWKIKGFPFITLGAISNTVVILLNGGRMPLSKETLVLAGLPPDTMDPKHILMGQNTILPFMGDIIPVNFLGLHYACSVGDLFVYTGLFLLIYLNAKRGVKNGKA
ncbi:DUF5317 domain-containing protein [Athalassotoga saccharophila]|uniref:DUF5317 domain-containing protein n=1 Tax=Athalassotoga saccharophila TaxID=1441386 RepID=UPI00137A07E9|nr:DUF5317 domain-containing protein [Athalassotoga saccharophila]BBJ27581.1 hypothetical protein ATHSA_0457 [Athalassotoga saccharophila]